MIFIDTNYFLRFFLGEPYDQATRVKALFQKAARGDVELSTSVVVFFEVYWVASSFYQVNEEKIAEFLQNMLKMEFVRLENRPLLVEAVSLFRDMNFDLEDAYNMAFARISHAQEFATFDVKLKKKSLEILKGTV